MKDLLLKDHTVIDMVLEEKKRQVQKWGIQDRHPFEWMAYIAEEAGELSCSISEFMYRGGLQSSVVKEAIQTATLCLTVAEMFLHYELLIPISLTKVKKELKDNLDPQKGGDDGDGY